MKAADDNGWDIDYEDTECLASSKWRWIAYSKDLNSGAEESWLGMDSKEIDMKCYVSNELTSEVEFSSDVDISAWATASAQTVNLKYNSHAAGRWTLGVFLAGIGLWAVL